MMEQNAQWLLLTSLNLFIVRAFFFIYEESAFLPRRLFVIVIISALVIGLSPLNVPSPYPAIHPFEYASSIYGSAQYPSFTSLNVFFLLVNLPLDDERTLANCAAIAVSSDRVT